MACSLFTHGDEQIQVPPDPPPSTTNSLATAATAVPYFGEESNEERVARAEVTQRDEPDKVLVEPPPATGSPPATTAAAVPYFGEESIEERVAKADTIVKARLDRATSEIITTTAEGWGGKYYVAVRFRLTVSEYLGGSGGNEITALWVRGKPFDTRTEAETAAPAIAAGRNTTWDNREAIFFLTEEHRDDIFSAAVQGANDFFLSIGGPYQDMYSLHNRYRKLWLPSAGTTATGDSQEFLLAAPEPGLATSTIALGELKRRVASVNAELIGGDGSDAYKDCIRNKHQSERIDAFRMSVPGSSGTAQYSDFEPRWGGTFTSGQPAGAELYEYDYGYVVTDDGSEEISRFWIDGQDADLFSIEEDDRRPVKDSEMRFSYSVVSVRPIPAGSYEFNHQYIPYAYLACERTSTFTITANALASEGTLHELFFDPVTVGSGVAADETNGVLKPATFTDANGGSATIGSISWESGTVKVKVTPDDSFANHMIYFIELAGTESLSLNVADATVDRVNDTLSWSVSSQPWEDGDLLMVRIREAR